MGDPRYKTSQWKRLRLRVFARDGYQCQIRGPKCTGNADQADHIIPVSQGGAFFDDLNVRASCASCNRARVNNRASDRWRMAPTRITLVIGPPRAGKHEHVEAHKRRDDLVVDYSTVANAIGTHDHRSVNEVRNSLLTVLRTGKSSAPAAWITSTDPEAEQKYPHHEVVVIDPGRDVVRHRLTEGRCPAEWLRIADAWYASRSATRDSPSRKW